VADPADVAHAASKRALGAAHRADRLPHALLFSGEEGIGKGELAMWLVQLRWCAADDAPCGHCPTCRKVATGNHPDLVIVSKDPTPEQDPEGWGSKHEVTVDQIRRGVLPTLALRATEGSGRAVILHDADDMNEEAQNALLKTLEEPPRGSLLILVTEREEALLETIRSRCQEIRLFSEAGLEPGALPGRPEQREGLDLEGVSNALDLLLQGELLATVFAGRVHELTDGEQQPEGIHRRLALRMMHQRLRELALAGAGAGSAGSGLVAAVDVARFPRPEGLLAAEKALLEASEDLRRHVPAHVMWVALGREIARVGVGGPDARNRYT
jgi:DNA polymerase III delta' subunit